MNLREVVRSGYKIFSRMNEEKRKAHILGIQYIEFLANQNNTKMEPWDLLEVFGTGKGNELVTDKTEINKRFFAKLEDIKNKTPAAAFAIESRIMEQMDALTRSNLDREINTLKRERDNHISNATRNFTAGHRELEAAHAVDVRIMALERRESTVPNQIAQIVQENFWEFHALNGPNLDLVTKNDLILTHKNPAAGVDLRVNFGKFKVSINLQNFSLKVLKHEGNLDLGNFYHPHVYTNGEVCWGTASGTVSQKLPKGELKDVLSLLASVLANYNDGNPYRHLAEFQEHAKHDAPPRNPPPPLPPGFATVEPRPAPPTIAEALSSGTTPPRLPGATSIAAVMESLAVNLDSYVGRAAPVSDEIFHRMLTGVDAAVVGGSPLLRDRRGEAGHPRDSTEGPMSGCSCPICTTAVTTRERREEYERLMRTIGPSSVIIDEIHDMERSS